MKAQGHAQLRLRDEGHECLALDLDQDSDTSKFILDRKGRA